MTIPINPSLNEEWTNDATDVTYKWDGERWYIVSTEAADNAATYVKKSGDTMTGELLFDGGNNIMIMNDQSLRLKSSRDDNPISSATHINVGRNADGDAVTGIYHLQRPQQPEWAVNMEYSDEQDQLLQDQIDDALETQAEIQSELNTLENKVDALEGTVVDGKWVAESRSNPREGGFDITSGGLQSMSDWEADYIRVHKTDSTGKVFTFAEVSSSDYVRIGAVGSSAVYKIVDVISGSLDWQTFEVELVNSTATPIPDLTYDFEFLPSFNPSAYATVAYVDAQDDLDVKLSGSQQLDPVQWRIKQNNQSGANRTFIDIYDGSMKLYHVQDPTNQDDAWAANKGYVDTTVTTATAGLASETYVDNAVSNTAGVPVGCIMIWMNSSAPAGWFKLQGGSFDVNQYPQLHAYLQGTSGYSNGRLPSWGGHYPGEYGDHIATSLGTKVGHRTAQPETGAPRSSNSIPNGSTRTFNATGGTNAYSNGASKVTINENWDSTTRPKTVVVHYIIKHD